MTVYLRLRAERAQDALDEAQSLASSLKDDPARYSPVSAPGSAAHSAPVEHVSFERS